MSATRVLEVERSQLGIVESPPNSNHTKYGMAYGLDRVAWCAIFQWWAFREAGEEHLIPKTAYTPAIAAWFRARGQWSTTPRIGSLVLFDFPGDGVARISHVGIVEGINPNGTLVTIEGNTSAGTSGSQRDGGGVFRRTRSPSGGIVGYGHPAYTATPTGSLQLPDTEDDLMGAFRITPDAGGRFHEAQGAEAGGGSQVAARGWLVFGSTYGGTTWTCAALAADGKVLGYWKDERTTNNQLIVKDLPAGTRCVTAEGQVDNAGTRPWASTYGVR